MHACTCKRYKFPYGQIKLNWIEWWPQFNNNNGNNWFLYSAFLVWDTTQGALQCIITPVTGFDFQSYTHSAPSQLPGEHSGQAPLQGRTRATPSDDNKVRILPGTHLHTWVERGNVDNVLTKVLGIDGNRTRYPLIQSQWFNPIYHGTSELVKAHSKYSTNCWTLH